MNREPNTQYVLSLSYGKDSIACLAAIEQLGLPLDRIIHAEVWATDTIPADLPPMVEFKKKADAIIKDRWGIEVEHICAMRGGKCQNYEGMFYRVLERGKFVGTIKGFPKQQGSWCKKLKSGSSEIDIPRYILSTYQQTPNQSYRGGRFKTMGFPMQRTPWCNGYLKAGVLDKNIRLPNAERSVVQQRTQNGSPTVFQCRSAEETGVPNSSKKCFQKPPMRKAG